MRYLKILGLAAVAAMALTAFVASSASATTLSITGVAQNAKVEISASLAPKTSALLVDEFGTTTDTCTVSTVEGATTSFTAKENEEIHGNISSLTFSSCTHTTDVIKAGKLFVGWTANTDGTVTSSEAEVTVQSTFFGASAICKTGNGTKIGTLKGVAVGSATMKIEAKINCGILGSASWTGEYVVTSPHALGVEK